MGGYILNYNFLEMLAVLSAFRSWISYLAGKRVHVYVDNYAISWGLYKLSMIGPAMAPLREIALLMAQFDVQTIVHWIPTNEHLLVDWLSRFMYKKIADVYPQLAALRQHQP